MKIFISWSGDRSKQIAEALRVWLPTVLAGNVECFVSSQDVQRGQRGLDVIAGELQDRDYGIVVLTKDNIASPWVNFEAGALGRTLAEGKVAPLLLDLTRADVVGPISQFQSTLLTDRNDFQQFIRDLATECPNLPVETVDTLFDAKWQELEQVVTAAAGLATPTTSRSTDSMLEEVLELVRRLERHQTPGSSDALHESVLQDRPGLVLYNRGSDGGLAARIDQHVVDAFGPDARGIKTKLNRAKGKSIFTVDTTSGADRFDLDALQGVSNDFNVKILIRPHNIVIEPDEASRHRAHVNGEPMATGEEHMEDD